MSGLVDAHWANLMAMGPSALKRQHENKKSIGMQHVRLDTLTEQEQRSETNAPVGLPRWIATSTCPRVVTASLQSQATGVRTAWKCAIRVIRQKLQCQCNVPKMRLRACSERTILILDSRWIGCWWVADSSWNEFFSGASPYALHHKSLSLNSLCICRGLSPPCSQHIQQNGLCKGFVKRSASCTGSAKFKAPKWAKALPSKQVASISPRPHMNTL